MNISEKKELLDLAKRVAEKGGKEALKYFRRSGLTIMNKARTDFDPVTDADLVAEAKMRSYIKMIRPDDAIVGEEDGFFEGSSGLTWTLDPVDGTRAFISGIPVWTVLVSISKNGFPILGVIYQPFTREFFVGGLGVSEYTRDDLTTTISVRQCGSLNSAFLSTTFPEIGTISEREAFKQVSEEVKLCRYGLDAYAYALLAMGSLDIVIEAGLKPYDIMAPIALIEAAGGIVTNWRGGPIIEGGQILACGDKAIHEAALKMLSIK